MDISYKIEELHWQIGKKLFDIRHARSEKMESVAISIGLTEATISKIESGKYTSLKLAHLMKFANYYQVLIEDITSARELEYLTSPIHKVVNKKTI